MKKLVFLLEEEKEGREKKEKEKTGIEIFLHNQNLKIQ